MHLETVVCGLRGHVVADGRCLRCDAIVDEEHPALDTRPRGGPPRRGRALRDAVVMRLIAIDRGLHAVVFGVVAIGLVLLRMELGPLQRQARALVDNAGRALADTGQDPSRTFLVRQLERVLSLNRSTLGVLILTAIAYCVVEGVEAVGLWRERRWAEYLTALATAGFLPFEIDELTKRVTVVRIGALAVNLAILAYLVWSKNLFKVRRALGAERAPSTA